MCTCYVVMDYPDHLHFPYTNESKLTYTIFGYTHCPKMGLVPNFEFFSKCKCFNLFSRRGVFCGYT